MPTIFNFFGLRENPFKINPDPRFLFSTDHIRATSAELAYAIQTRKGLILLTGEVGTGKTMLIRRLLDWLSEQKMPTALVFNSHIKPEHLLDLILNDFGVPCSSTLKSDKLMALNRWLLKSYRAGATPVLIVDEAQGLDTSALEEIRLLLNFETPREKLLQIVLAGQPELETKLRRYELRQLRQRITVRCRTVPLTLEQTYGYIGERLRIAGANGKAIFQSDAVAAIHAYSKGIPRVVNVLAEHSLINACAEGSGGVSPTAVEQAAHDCQLDRVDSVARMLSCGSLLDAISAASTSVSEAIHQQQSVQASRSAPQEAASPYDAQPSTAPQAVTSTSAAENYLDEYPVQDELTAVEVRQAETHQVDQVQESVTLPQSFSVEDTIQVDDTAAEPVAIESAVTPPPSLLHFLRLWSRSFISDALATSRQFRRAIRSFEARRWNPFTRDLRHQLHRLRARVSGLPSHPGWKRLRSRASFASRTWSDSFKSAMPSWLAKPFGVHPQATRKRAQANLQSRLNRRRAILSLRRWLRQPLTTQQKRVKRNPRHSTG
jgi:general secretion pathway protein A